MPLKAAPIPEGPITRGKGLDTLDRFIIQNWAPPTRFGVWREHSGALAPPKMALDHFLKNIESQINLFLELDKSVKTLVKKDTVLGKEIVLAVSAATRSAYLDRELTISHFQSADKVLSRLLIVHCHDMRIRRFIDSMM